MDISSSGQVRVLSMPIQNKLKRNHLDYFKHFPQPVFLIDRHLKLLSKNIQGSLAIEKLLVSLIGNKLHFNNKENDHIVVQLIKNLRSNATGFGRFILANADSVYRSYTISKTANAKDIFLLNIQDNLFAADDRMLAVTRAFTLSPSESRVLNCMIDGLKPKQIASELGISLCTVRSHLRTLYAKMRVRDYNEALMQAVRLMK